MIRELSERQIKMLDYIREYLQEYGYPPSIRELGKAAGISSTSVVSYNLNKLRERGFIMRNDKVSRGLRLAEDAVTSLLEVPLLGTIGAGTHIQPRDNDWLEPALGMIGIPPEMTADAAETYAVRVQGDSMIDALIADGDIVVLHHQETANSGDFVAAWLPKQEIMTLKEFQREPDKRRIRLQPYNRSVEPIYVDSEEDIEIQGKVIAVIRQIG